MPKLNFSSDNVAGATPEILAALAAINAGDAPSYGADDSSARLEVRFAEIFEHPVAVFPLSTGTAANALAVAATTPPWGAAYCHRAAHLAMDEANAPEFFSHGAKLVTVGGADAKLDPAALAGLMPGLRGDVHQAQPSLVSLTQATECGTAYRAGEIGAVAEVARRHRLAVHMDGARFANAVAYLGVAPAELTWRAGVDILSFGATKNGAIAAEALLFFDPAGAEAQAAGVAFRRKRAGHLLSKMRFLSVQLEAYLADEAWLRHAGAANASAVLLARGLAALPGVRLHFPVEANLVFVHLPATVVSRLSAAGYRLFERPDLAQAAGIGPEFSFWRLVTAWDTTPADIEALLAIAAAA